jgi:hypothetical protein
MRGTLRRERILLPPSEGEVDQNGFSFYYNLSYELGVEMHRDDTGASVGFPDQCLERVIGLVLLQKGHCALFSVYMLDAFSYYQVYYLVQRQGGVYSSGYLVDYR